MRKLLCFVLVLLLCISSYQSNAETYVVQQIVFSNISSDSVTSDPLPKKYNHLVGGSKTSIHMRGRAWDAPDDTLYAKVKTEFCGSYSTPINLSTEMWGSRVYPSGNSGGYRLEKMAPDYPRDGIWLHLDTPRTGTVN